MGYLGELKLLQSSDEVWQAGQGVGAKAAPRSAADLGEGVGHTPELRKQRDCSLGCARVHASPSLPSLWKLNEAKAEGCHDCAGAGSTQGRGHPPREGLVRHLNTVKLLHFRVLHEVAAVNQQQLRCAAHGLHRRHAGQRLPHCNPSVHVRKSQGVQAGC